MSFVEVNKHRSVVIPTLDKTFPRAHRLGGKEAFSAVYDAKTRESRGPLTAYALPNDLGHPRLGLSVSRRVGIAVKRNRIKRLLREAFRHRPLDPPLPYDFVIVVRPHEELPVERYRELLTALMAKLNEAWRRKVRG